MLWWGGHVPRLWASHFFLVQDRRCLRTEAVVLVELKRLWLSQVSYHFTVFSFHRQGLVHFKETDQPDKDADKEAPTDWPTSGFKSSSVVSLLDESINSTPLFGNWSGYSSPVYMCLISSWRCTGSPEVSLRAPGIVCWGPLKQGWSCVCISSSNLGDVGQKIMHFSLSPLFCLWSSGTKCWDTSKV